jgi:single-strand DNA-binding protein
MATRSVNKVMLLGNLTRDPELRYTPKGTAVMDFGLATNRDWVSDGERQESVEFHNIVVWGKLAELCDRMLQKGSKVYVEGRLQTSDWETDAGEKRYKTEVVINEMLLLGNGKPWDDSSSGSDSNSSANANGSSAPKSEDTGSSEDSEIEDIDLDELLEDTDFDLEE